MRVVATVLAVVVVVAAMVFHGRNTNGCFSNFGCVLLFHIVVLAVVVNVVVLIVLVMLVVSSGVIMLVVIRLEESKYRLLLRCLWLRRHVGCGW